MSTESNEKKHEDNTSSKPREKELNFFQKLDQFKNHVTDTAKSTVNKVSDLKKKAESQVKDVKATIDNLPKKYDKQLMKASESFNKDFSYTAMLFRTHGTHMIFSTTIASGLLTWRIIGFKTGLLVASATLASASAASYVAEYKWKK